MTDEDWIKLAGIRRRVTFDAGIVPPHSPLAVSQMLIDRRWLICKLEAEHDAAVEACCEAFNEAYTKAIFDGISNGKATKIGLADLRALKRKPAPEEK